MAYVIRADHKDMKAILPEPLNLEDDVIEFWYVIHRNTMIGPYMEMGVTFSASLKAQDGQTYKAGYYPYMYLSNDSGVSAGRSRSGFRRRLLI